MPFARRRARRHLEEAIRLAREAETSGFEAQALIDMGLLYKASRQPAAARDYFGQARRVAEALGAVELISRIDTLL